MNIDIIELIGYLATVLVIISFLFKSIVPLRIVNAIGAALFVVYALATKSYPVALLNAFLIVIHLYQLWKLKRT